MEMIMARHGQAERVRKPFQERGRHGLTRHVRPSEVEPNETGEKVRVLYVNRSVETHFVAKLGDGRFVVTLAHHAENGITGKDIDKEERHRRHAEKNGDEEENAFGGVRQHRLQESPFSSFDTVDRSSPRYMTGKVYPCTRSETITNDVGK